MKWAISYVLTQCQDYWRRNNTCKKDVIKKKLIFPGWWNTSRDEEKRGIIREKWNGKIQSNEFKWRCHINTMHQNNHANLDKNAQMLGKIHLRYYY